MAFDPDLYLKEQITKGNVSAAKTGFDPDAYLNNKGTPIYADVPTVVGERPNIVRYEQNAQTRPSTMMDKVKAVYEVPATIGSAMVSQPASMLYGVGRSVVEGAMQGQAPSPEARDMYYKQARQATQFEPTSPTSIAALESIGSALEESKLPPYFGNIGTIPSAIQSGNAARAITQQTIQSAKPVVNRMANALRSQVTVEGAPTMSGVGAAEVPKAVQRAQMAEQLRVPIKLSKGEATRDLGQQQFEAETMKTYPEDVGRPLIAAKEQRNAQIGQNLDAYVDATGAKVANEFYLRPTGEAVDDALRESATKARKEYKTAYDVARASEEGQQKVNVQSIINTLDDMEAEALTASVIDSAKMKLKKLAPDGEITLNKLEEVRKLVNTVKDTPSQVKYGGDIKAMIDAVTENAGGDLFKEARRLRTKFANEFENIGLINDLISTKPNSRDRVIVMEKVFDKSVMQSDLDSLKALGYTLKKTQKGQQAWAELKGQTIENLRSAITSNIETDSLGQRTFNPKQFDVIVKNLDKSGKLDYLLGKAGAQEIRNLRDTVITINSPVKGTNTSNSSSAINKVFNGILKKTVGKVPFGGAMVEAGAEAIEKKNIAKQVKESLEFNTEDMAKELRKGK